MLASNMKFPVELKIQVGDLENVYKGGQAIFPIFPLDQIAVRLHPPLRAELFQCLSVKNKYHILQGPLQRAPDFA